MRGYTEEQMVWLADNAKGSTWQRLAAAYNERFGTAHSVQRLKTHCNRHGIFVTEPLNGKPSWNAKPVGHICPTSNGYARIKTAGGYEMLARLNMPANMRDMVCCHFDGDRMSADAKYHSKRAQRRYALLCRYNKGFPAYRETAMMICELDVKVKERRNNK